MQRLEPLASPIKLCSRVRHFLFFFLLTNRNIYVLWRRKFPWIWLIACCNFLGINSFSWRWDGRKDFCALKYNELLNKRRNKRRKKMSHDLLMPFYRNKINKNRKKMSESWCEVIAFSYDFMFINGRVTAWLDRLPSDGRTRFQISLWFICRGGDLLKISTFLVPERHSLS